MDEDAELIRQFLLGERLAGTQLVLRHQPALFNWLLLKCGSREEAEDLCQIVWIDAFRALAQFQSRAQFRSWLFTIGRNEFYSWLRRRRDRATCSLETLEELDNRGFAAVVAGVALDEMGAALDRIALEKALAGLSEDHRETFLLRYVSQLTASEVSQLLQVPEGTVESRCHFARQLLRRALEPPDPVCAAIKEPVSGRRSNGWFQKI